MARLKRAAATGPPRRRAKTKEGKSPFRTRQLLVVGPAAGGSGEPLARILAYCPIAENDFGEACSKVYEHLANNIEAHGLECLAAVCDLVAAWPARPAAKTTVL